MFKVPEGRFFLIKFRADYVDEFDVEGLTVLILDEAILEEDIWNQKVLDQNVSLGFGTNEGIDFYSKNSCDWWRIIPITEEEYEAIYENILLPLDSFGTIFLPSDIRNHQAQDMYYNEEGEETGNNSWRDLYFPEELSETDEEPPL